MENFSTRIFQQVENYPDKQILHVLKSGQEDRHFTYRQLISSAKRYTYALQSAGVKPGEVVILILQHGLELIYAYFGVILNGSIPSIMPFLTEKLLPEKYHKDLVSLIEITQPTAIITFNDFSAELQQVKSENSSLKAILLAENIEKIKLDDEVAYSGLSRNSNDIVLLQHSSGSTGLQKGVALSHEAVFNQLESYAKTIHLQEKDVIISWLPLYHDMGLIACFLMPILCGIPLVIMSPFDWVRAPHRLFQSISKYAGTLCWLPNFAYNFCAQKIRSEDLEGVDLTSVRAFINCSEPMRYESHKMFLDRFSGYGLKTSAITTCYAMAENVFAVTQDGIEKPVTYDEIDQEVFQREQVARKAEPGTRTVFMVSAGRTIEHTQVKIIDQKGKELPERHLGEIVIKSNCMLSGYYHRQDATEESFINDWFKTGDLGYLAGDELYISGRKKDLIIVGGKNVYPQDIESISMEVEGVHPGRVVAFGVFNDDKGTEDVVVIAEIEKEFEKQSKEIAENIRKAVTQSSAIALRHVYLVNDKWLIKTSSGKIARSANKEKYLAEMMK